MALSGSVDSVIASIRDDAASEVERIETSAADDAAALRAGALQAPAVASDRDQRLAVARRHSAELLAQAEWEARRAFLEQRERWIESVAARGREILRQTPPERLAGLRAEAIAMVGGERAEVIPAEGGGCIARAGDLVFDNSFEERIRRFEPAWRAALAEMYKP